MVVAQRSTFPSFAPSTIKYGVELGGQPLPAELARRRLPINPKGRLSFKDPRFVPRDEAELLAAIFSWWEILDGLMVKHEPFSRFIGGYIREVQLRRMLQLVAPSSVSHYCEGARTGFEPAHVCSQGLPRGARTNPMLAVGMNGGHSVVSMLQGNPQVKAHVFDLMNWNYSRPVASLLKSTFRDRFELHEGLSHNTIPPWIASQNGTLVCDLLLVDGGHRWDTARNDMLLLKKVSKPRARIVIDDINVGPGQALKRLEKMGELRILEAFTFPKKTEHNPCQRKPEGRTFPCGEWGIAVAEYRSR